MGAYITTNHPTCQVHLSPGAISGSSQWRPGLPSVMSLQTYDMHQFNLLYPGYISVPLQCRPTSPTPPSAPPPPPTSPTPSDTSAPSDAERRPSPETGDPPPEGCGPSMIVPDDDHYYKQDQKDKYTGTSLDQLVQPIGGALTQVGVYTDDVPQKTQEFSVDIRETKAGTAVDVFHEAQGKGVLIFHAAMLEDQMLHGSGENPDSRWPTTIPEQSMLMHNSGRADGSTGDDAKTYLSFGTPQKGSHLPASGGYFDLEVVSDADAYGFLIYNPTDGSGEDDSDFGIKIDGHLWLEPSLKNGDPHGGMVVVDVDDGNWLTWHDGTQWQKPWTDDYGHPDPHRLADGSSEAPAYSFDDDTDMGMWRDTASTPDALAFSDRLGNQRLNIDDSGLSLFEVSVEPASVAGRFKTFVINNDPNTLEGKDDDGGRMYIGVRHNIIRAYLNSDQGLTAETWEKVSLNAESFDLEGTFDDTNPNNRFQPNIPGYYQVNWNAEFSYLSKVEEPVNPLFGVDSFSAFKTALYKNGAPYSQGSTDGFYGIKDSELRDPIHPESHGSDIVYLDGDADYIELYAWAYNEAGTTILINEGEAKTYMSATLINKK